MIPVQTLQKTIDEISSLTGAALVVMDAGLKVVAADPSAQKPDDKKIIKFMEKEESETIIEGYQALKVWDEDQIQYILFVEGDEKKHQVIGRMIKYQLESLVAVYKEKIDKDHFLRALIQDNLLQIDIYTQAKKLEMDTELKRAVIIIETNNKNLDEIMRPVKFVFANKPEDSIFLIDNKRIVIVKKLEEEDDDAAIEELSKEINNTIKVDTGEEAYISYGTIVKDLKDVSRSYKEAKTSLDIGRTFYSDRRITGYTKLGIGRLMYQVPLPVCKRFMKEIFGSEKPPELDKELIETVNKFLECSLNISETSRQLFVHRNTLVYRLDRIQESTGLDLRNFDDAITFKLSMMVSEVMNSIKNQDDK